MKTTIRLVLAVLGSLLWVGANADTYALIIGIADYQTPTNDDGTPIKDANGDVIDNDLKGCVNDAKAYQKLLITTYSVNPANIRLLTNSKATIDNVVDAFAWMMTASEVGDQIFFAFSGHGAQIDALDPKDEGDDQDEVLVLYDGLLVDDDLKEIAEMFQTVGRDVTIVLDSCYSGGMSRTVLRRTKSQTVDTLSVSKTSILSFKKQVSTQAQQSEDASIKKGAFTLIAAGKENQQTIDVSFTDGTPAQGVFTYVFVAILEDSPEMSIRKAVEETRLLLKSTKFDQVPHMESNPVQELDSVLIQSSDGG